MLVTTQETVKKGKHAGFTKKEADMFVWLKSKKKKKKN